MPMNLEKDHLIWCRPVRRMSRVREPSPPPLFGAPKAPGAQIVPKPKAAPKASRPGFIPVDLEDDYVRPQREERPSSSSGRRTEDQGSSEGRPNKIQPLTA